jgi:hypothetical protein
MWCCIYSEPDFDWSQFLIHPELKYVLCPPETVRVESIDGLNTFLRINSGWSKTEISITSPPMPKEYYLNRYCRKFFGKWVYIGDNKKPPQKYLKV